MGQPTGALGKLAAHRAPGHLHRAISVFLLEPDGRLLIQRWAATKYHSAGLWSNTCCGHPGPREPVAAAAMRCLAVELGLHVYTEDLPDAGVAVYTVSDEASGLVESESDHLLVGTAPGPTHPDPREVAEVESVPLEAFEDRLADGRFSAWFPTVLSAAMPVLLSTRDQLLALRG